MKTLVYFTIGWNSKYIDCLALAIKSLQHFYKDCDIWVLCDESFVDTCKLTLQDETIRIISCSQSKSPEDASMRKLTIFDYDIQIYDAILFIDSDILVHTSLDSILDQIRDPTVLYVCTEIEIIKAHSHLMWSLENYTSNDLKFLTTNEIYPFNAGLFAFMPSEEMKSHFQSIRNLIQSHKGQFFYEQSFMNVYFNLNNKTNRTVFTINNYRLNPDPNTSYEGKLVHFCGGPSDGLTKYTKMKAYVSSFMQF